MYNISKCKPFLPQKIISDDEVKEFINKDISMSILNKYYHNNNGNQSLSNRITINSLSINNHNESNNNINTENDTINKVSTYNIYKQDENNKLQNNLPSYSTINIDTTMCLNCNGQIPTTQYLPHLEKCYQSSHVEYEQNNDIFTQVKDNKNDLKYYTDNLLNVDDLLFSTPYQAICIPANPLEIKIEEQSESDIETVSALCPPDINDRKKVIAGLIKKKNRYAYKPKQSPPTQHKELEMFHKVYTKLVEQQKDDWDSAPQSIEDTEEEEEDEYDDDVDDDVEMQDIKTQKQENGSNDKEHLINNNTEDSDDDDDDDDIPIAQNLRNQNEKNKKIENGSGLQTNGNGNGNNKNINNDAEKFRSPRGYNLRTRSPTKPAKQMASNSSTQQTPKKKNSNGMDEVKTNHEPSTNNNNLNGNNNSNSSLSRKQKYKLEYKQMTNSFKKFNRYNKLSRMKRKQKMFIKREKNANKLVSDILDRYSQRIEKDKKIIKDIYDIINRDCNIHRVTRASRYRLNINYSKNLLDQLINCSMKTRHCGFIYKEPITKRPKKEDDGNNGKQENDDECKTMRMEVDDKEKGNDNKNNNDDKDDKDDEDEFFYEYYCHEKLNRNGTCPIHKNWRKETYKQLKEKLKEEIEKLFIYGCIIKQTKQLLRMDMANERFIQHEYLANDEVFNNDMDLFDYNGILNPCVSLQNDATQSDIDIFNGI